MRELKYGLLEIFNITPTDKHSEKFLQEASLNTVLTITPESLHSLHNVHKGLEITLKLLPGVSLSTLSEARLKLLHLFERKFYEEIRL